MGRFGALMIIAGVALATSGCASTQAQGEARPSVTGTVALPTGAEVTDGVEIHVRLLDQTDSGTEIGSQSIVRPDAFPVAFDVKYDPKYLASDHSYAIEVSVEVRGKTKFKSAPIAVLTQGNPINVQVQTEATE